MFKKLSVAILLAAMAGTPAVAAGAVFKAPSATSGFGFKARGPGAQQITNHCSSILSCNVLISLCAEWGGTWTETGRPGPHGEPQKGTCVS